MSLFGGIEIPGRPDLENVRKLDLLAIPMIRRARRLGFAIDPGYFAELTLDFEAQIREVERDIISYIPADRLHEFSDAATAIEEEIGDVAFNPASSDQIGKLLFDILRVGEGMQLKTTKSGKKLSTGKRQLELVKLRHPIVPRILRHRELTKLVTTYTTKLPKLAVLHPRGSCCPVCELQHDTSQMRVHGEMGTTRAATGRINHKNPNLGNIPIRTEDGQKVLAGFIAPPGKRLVKADASQIELRELAHLANERSMIAVYEADGDIHDNTARKVFKLAADVKPDKIKHRMASKRTNFGIQNGTTEKGLYMQLVMDYGSSGLPVPEWLTEEWCKWFIKEWLGEYKDVEPFFDLQHYRARRYGMSWDMFGRIRLIPEVKSFHPWIKQAGLRQAQNLPVTSSAAGVLKLAMGRADRDMWNLLQAGQWCWPLLTIHDAIMAEADEGDAAENVLELLQIAIDESMRDEESREWRFRVPIKSDGGVMERWTKD